MYCDWILFQYMLLLSVKGRPIFGLLTLWCESFSKTPLLIFDTPECVGINAFEVIFTAEFLFPINLQPCGYQCFEVVFTAHFLSFSYLQP